MTKKITIQDDFYTTIDYATISDGELTHAEFRIYVYMKLRIQFFEKRGWDYYESLPTIAKNTKTDKKTVSRAIQKFRKLNYMNVVKEVGKSNKYILLERDGVPF